MRPVRAATTARKSTSSTSSWRPTTRRSQWPTPDRHYRHRRPSHPARVPRLGRRPVDLPVRSRSDRPAGPRQPGVHRPRALAPADSCGRDRSAMVPQPGLDVGWPDSPHRALRNSTARAWDAAGRPPDSRRPGAGDVIAHFASGEGVVRYEPAPPMVGTTGDIDALSMWAGQSVALARKPQSAADIVTELTSRL